MSDYKMSEEDNQKLSMLMDEYEVGWEDSKASDISIDVLPKLVDFIEAHTAKEVREERGKINKELGFIGFKLGMVISNSREYVNDQPTGKLLEGEVRRQLDEAVLLLKGISEVVNN
jgi:hypothetical protein